VASVPALSWDWDELRTLVDAFCANGASSSNQSSSSALIQDSDLQYIEMFGDLPLAFWWVNTTETDDTMWDTPTLK